MAPTLVDRSFSMTDLDTIAKQPLINCHNLATPFDFSAAIGYEDKKNIFKLSYRPWRTSFLSKKKSSTLTKAAGEKVKANLVPASGAFHKHNITGSKDGKSSQIRPRSKSEGIPQQYKYEEKYGDLRNTKSLMLLPHLPRSRAKLMRNESALIVGFPEKSVLLLAQAEDDRTQIQLSTSSVASKNSQQYMRRRKGDSGVHISDGVVLTWTREEQSRLEPTNPSTSGLLSNQYHLRRVATKSSLQSNYIPSLEKLIEEPVLTHKVCGQLDSSSKFETNQSVNSWPNERKEFNEVVVSHWERAEQHQCTPHEPATTSGRSPSSSFSLLNEVTEEVLFKRSSTNISVSRTDHEEDAKNQKRQRRVTIATESPSKELSPHYATQLEKQAFKKIKEWKAGFAIKLDQVLQQRQLTTERLDNKAKGIKEEHIAYPSPRTPPCLDKTFHTSPSPSHTTPSKSAEKTFRVDAHKQLIDELRGVSETSMVGITNGRDTGSTILNEIKKQRKFSKGLNEKKRIMEDLSSWHKQETGRIAKDLFTCVSGAENVRQILASLKETVYDIFVATMQRVGDFAVSSSSNKNNAVDPEQVNDTDHQEILLRWQVQTAQEERDRLFLENITLKKEVDDLQNRLMGATKVIAELTSLKQDQVKVMYSHNAQVNMEKFIRTENFQENIGCFEEYAGNFPLNDEELLLENQATFELLRARQVRAELGAIHSANLNLSAENHFDCLELFSTWDCPYTGYEEQGLDQLMLGSVV